MSLEEKEPMIPVWNGRVFRKPRLPRAFSWVIGVERLSKRFADVPQFNSLQVWFDEHPVEGNYRMTMIKASTSQIPQQVFTVWYSARGEAKWYFMVYPVESAKRACVRELLEAQTFPVVEKWLKAEHTKVWLQADKHLRCIWDRTTDRIEVKEELR
jgi:hypothetical protein